MIDNVSGRVIRNTGSWYVVLTNDGREIPCKVKGKFRLRGIRTTNPVAVGDIVSISDLAPDGTAFITEISPRTNYIIRRASNLSKESHILAANLDQTMLIVTLAHPTTSTTFIDRFLATAEAYRVPAIIVINKVDLLTDDDDRELLESVAYLYRSIGYKVIEVSAATGQGLDDLRNALKDKITLLSGNSGVGKTTIINCLLPGLDLPTRQISDIHDTGMHTTTFSQMYPLPEGGWIIDTPGVKGFGTIDFDKSEVGHFFPEIFKESANCRYGDCTHTHEPGCAVLQAVDDALIARSRYASYLSILQGDTDAASADKYRKPY